MRGRSAPALKGATVTNGAPTGSKVETSFIPDSLGYTVLSACQFDKEANDLEEGGALTLGLIRALRTTGFGGGSKVSYGELYDLVKQNVLDLSPPGNPQEPVLQGNDTNLIFGNGQVKAPDYYETRFRGGVLSVEAGRMFGILPGTVFDLYRPGDSPESGGRKIGVGVVSPKSEDLQYNRAVVTLEHDVPAQELESCWAFRRADSGDPAVVPIHFDAVPQATRTALIRAFDKLPAPFSEVSAAAAGVTLSESGGDKIVLSSRDAGDLGTFAADEEGLKGAGRALQDYGRWRGLKSLASASPGNQKEFDLQIVPVKVDADGSFFEPDSAPLVTAFRAHQEFALRVRWRNPLSKHAQRYISVLHLTATRKVAQEWPQDGREDSPGSLLTSDGDSYWLGRETGLIPDSERAARRKEIMVWWFEPTLGPNPQVGEYPDGYGAQQYLVFATRDPVNLRPLLSPNLHETSTRGASSPLAVLIRRICSGTTRAGYKAVASDYGVATKIVTATR